MTSPFVHTLVRNWFSANCTFTFSKSHISSGNTVAVALSLLHPRNQALFLYLIPHSSDLALRACSFFPNFWPRLLIFSSQNPRSRALDSPGFSWLLCFLPAQADCVHWLFRSPPATLAQKAWVRLNSNTNISVPLCPFTTPTWYPRCTWQENQGKTPPCTKLNCKLAFISATA